jgi:hypothetical protein
MDLTPPYSSILRRAGYEPAVFIFNKAHSICFSSLTQKNFLSSFMVQIWKKTIHPTTSFLPELAEESIYLFDVKIPPA